MNFLATTPVSIDDHLRALGSLPFPRVIYAGDGRAWVVRLSENHWCLLVDDDGETPAPWVLEYLPAGDDWRTRTETVGSVMVMHYLHTELDA